MNNQTHFNLFDVTRPCTNGEALVIAIMLAMLMTIGVVLAIR